MEKIKEVNRFVESVGIDVSKLTLDVFLYNKRVHHQFANTIKGFAVMQKWIKSELGSLDDLV
jgi:hypothetical protein